MRWENLAPLFELFTAVDDVCGTVILDCTVGDGIGGAR